MKRLLDWIHSRIEVDDGGVVTHYDAVTLQEIADELEERARLTLEDYFAAFPVNEEYARKVLWPRFNSEFSVSSAARDLIREMPAE